MKWVRGTPIVKTKRGEEKVSADKQVLWSMHGQFHEWRCKLVDMRRSFAIKRYCLRSSITKAKTDFSSILAKGLKVLKDFKVWDIGSFPNGFSSDNNLETLKKASKWSMFIWFDQKMSTIAIPDDRTKLSNIHFSFMSRTYSLPCAVAFLKCTLKF